MNSITQELLTALAKGAGLTIVFPDGAPVCISGFPDGQPRYVNSDQPESDLIFNILRSIALESCLPLPMPWFLNRPYQNMLVGHIAHTIRRLMRQKLNNEWRAEAWAMCAYIKFGRFDLLGVFFWRHHDKLPLLFWTWLGLLKARLVQIINTPGRVLRLLFNPKSA